jgi:acyl-CoA-binding protein
VIWDIEVITGLTPNLSLHSQKQPLAMELKQLFEKAAEESKELSDRPSNDTLLQLYSLYKQSIEGDVNVDPPSNPFDFVSRAKYEAWSALKGKTKDAAMQEYVDLVNKLKN